MGRVWRADNGATGGEVWSSLPSSDDCLTYGYSPHPGQPVLNSPTAIFPPTKERDYNPGLMIGSIDPMWGQRPRQVT